MSIVSRSRLFAVVEVDNNKELDYLDTPLMDMNLETQRAFRIPQSMEFRPDLISFKFFGTFHLGWLLAIHNDFQDPIMEFTKGKLINIPSIEEYYRFYQRNARTNRS